MVFGMYPTYRFRKAKRMHMSDPGTGKDTAFFSTYIFQFEKENRPLQSFMPPLRPPSALTEGPNIFEHAPVGVSDSNNTHPAAKPFLDLVSRIVSRPFQQFIVDTNLSPRDEINHRLGRLVFFLLAVITFTGKHEKNYNNKCNNDHTCHVFHNFST